MSWWVVAASANVVIFSAYAVIAATISRGLIRSRRSPRANPLGWATAAIFEDPRERQRRALEIHDNVVQGLAVAKLSLESGRPEEGLRAVERALEASRQIITDLLGDDGAETALRPGELRRARPAGTGV